MDSVTLKFLLLAAVAYALVWGPQVALAQGQEVRVGSSPSTEYYSVTGGTVRAPSGVNMTRGAGVPSVTVTPGGGYSQSMPAGITIEAIKKQAPIGAKLAAGASAVAAALVRCVGNPVCSVVAAGSAYGLQQWLDSHGFDMDEQGNVTTLSDDALPAMTPPVNTGAAYSTMGRNCNSGDLFPTAAAACMHQIRNATDRTFSHITGNANPYFGCVFKDSQGNTYGSTQMFRYQCNNANCTAGTVKVDGVCVARSQVQLSQEQVAAASGDYSPHESDWPWISKGIDFSAPDVNIELDNFPTFTSEPDVTVMRDGQGMPTGRSETVRQDTVSATPGSNPGKQPELRVETTVTTTNYDINNTVINSTTQTVTSTAENAIPEAPPAEPAESLCKEFPDVLACWQAGEVSEAETLPEDTIALDFTPVTVPGENAACPAPITFTVQGQSFSMPWTHVCQFATGIKPIILIMAWISASLIVMGAIKGS